MSKSNVLASLAELESFAVTISLAVWVKLYSVISNSRSLDGSTTSHGSIAARNTTLGNAMLGSRAAAVAVAIVPPLIIINPSTTTFPFN
tara:strand:+ start:1962 stop:2228 length:267 start_codon:yes stop_codon:yes gene_type:complete